MSNDPGRFDRGLEMKRPPHENFKAALASGARCGRGLLSSELACDPLGCRNLGQDDEELHYYHSLIHATKSYAKAWLCE